MEIADEIVVMNKGRVEQVGSPTDVYDHPASPFVMGFVGPVNEVPTRSGILPANGKAIESDRVFLRPHDLEIESQPFAEAVPATVDRVVHLGWEIIVELLLESGELVTAHLSRDRFDQLHLQPQQPVFVKPKVVKTFPAYALN